MSFSLKNRTLHFAALALFVWSLQNSVAAQQHVNLERGLNAQSYLSGEFDHVNLYNGNLTLTVPIGQSYKVGGSFDYSLTLIYNSNAWYFKRENQPNQAGPRVCMSTMVRWYLCVHRSIPTALK